MKNRVWYLAAALLAALAPGARAQDARVQDLVKAAAQEGQLAYWDAVIQPETNDLLTAAFIKTYGLPSSFKVTYTLSNTSGLVTRVDQELQANRVTIDVAAIASLPWVYGHISHGDFLEYESPQYAAYSKVFALNLGRKGFSAPNGAYLFVPMWNADSLDFKGTSFKDVVGAVANGRLTIGDAAKSETYLLTYMAQSKVWGLDYFRALAKMSPNFVVRSEQIAARLVSSEDLMAYSGMPTRAYQSNALGAKLKFILPTEGVVLLPQNTFILKAAPHPAAAKLWIDFILSEAGQKILVEREAMISGRDGFESPLPVYAPAISSINVIPVDWNAISADDMKSARTEWSGIFTP
jgi:iron(III) transport system substrate-binding protein